MKKHILLLLLLLVIFSEFQLQKERQARIQEVPIVHTIYLPLVMMPALPALKGVGLSSIHQIDVGAIRAEWFYNWGTRPPSPDSRFVPMMYDADMRYLPEAVQAAKFGSGWILGYNEPDWNGMTPKIGAVAWREIEVAMIGIKLASPAPSQHDPSWLWRMVDAYRQMYGYNPRFDAIACHIYTKDPTTMRKYLLARRNEALARGYNLPIWITEWGGLCTLPDPDNGNIKLMQEMVPWLKEQPWIGRYAWFASRIKEQESWGSGWHHCSLINADTGQLTQLGKIYKEYQ